MIDKWWEREILNHFKKMEAVPGRRFLQQLAAKLELVIVANITIAVLQLHIHCSARRSFSTVGSANLMKYQSIKTDG